MRDCIFCKIASGEIPAKEVYRDERVVAIEDLNPQAPTHLLVLPVAHHDTIADASSSAGPLAGELIDVAARLGTERGGEAGFRLVVNTGADGGQTVGHVHVHVLAGRPMTWPPG
ncbi:MAG TPA: histidine triad nucleotide-binding protein [Candidatus Cybelea sp.]|jgi:histidine triad (HIT) family protein|nr:histidine triad nucleotide-binding protein [Candidatus Cybelea sp.]